MSTIAVDVGNTSIHFGWFDEDAPIPMAKSTLNLSSAKVSDGAFDEAQLAEWIPNAASHCYIASVFHEADQRLIHWLQENRPALSVQKIRSEDFPITNLVDDPASVGADRVAAAVAANALRREGQAAIIVDSGTAITVDAVDAKGQFLGGAIAPGWRMSADALHRVADQLPLITPTEQQPLGIGKNTTDAMRSGLYWGAIGTVRELTAQLQAQMKCECDVLVTGGGAEMLARHLVGAQVHAELVLVGILLAGKSNSKK